MIKITVPGQPIAQQRPRFSKANFKVFDPNREDKIEIREKIRSKAPKKPFEGGVYLTLNFYTQRPLQHFVGKKTDNKLRPEAPLWKVSRPDIDNLVKFIMDVLDEFILDDSQICKLITTKKYSVKPKTVIEIGELEDDTKSKTKATKIL